MRISDDRYSRDRLRFDIALRFIQHEARTQTIRLWTGLTDDRIRKLYRSYLAGARGASVTRHRGKSPQRPSFFMRTLRARQEAALLASLCRMLGVLAAPATDALQSQQGVGRAQLLCQAYEIYRHFMPDGLISFEHAAFLVTALTRGEELTLGHCRDCGGVVVADRLSLRPPRCGQCAGAALAARGRSAAL
jgi:hypothetical protein